MAEYLTNAQVRKFLKGFTYKPWANMELIWRQVTHMPGYNLVCEMDRNDVNFRSCLGEGRYEIARVRSVHIKYSLPRDIEELTHWVLCLIEEAEKHELTEWLRYNGKHVKEPHPND